MLIALVLGLSVLALVVAWGLRSYVLRQDTGTADMRKISDAIQEGAEAFLRRQYRTIGLLSIALGVLIYVLYAFFRKPHPDEPAAATLALTTTLSFLFGALCSGVAGIVGMYVAVRSNIRSASAARSSLNKALQIALRGGAVSGLFVVSMSLFGVGLLYTVLEALHFEPTKIPLMIVGYGFGASFVALFAQLGGGIYTKAADVGADLVGKVEAGIPEDDPRNPAVIADLVGDNVGDCAGRGADLFESTAAENIGAMILGSGLALANTGVFSPTQVVGLMLFPLVARAFGLVASIIGVLVVKAREDEDPMQALNRGYMWTALLAAAGFVGGTYWLLNPAAHPAAWWHFALCGVIGIATSIAFVYITQYYTEYRYRPVKSIAAASVTGPATNIIAGFAVALECTALPTFTISAAIIASYKLGASSGLVHSGLFGTAVATMGMLGTAAYILAMDTFGPITDNAGGIIEMSHQPEDIRRRTDRLDAGRRRQHHQGAHQGICHRVRGAGRVPAVLRVPGRGRGAGLAARLRRYFEARGVRGRAVRRHARVLVLGARHQRGDEGRRQRDPRGTAAVQGRPWDSQRDVAARLRSGGGYRHRRGAEGDGGSRSARRGHADRRGTGLQAVVPCRRRDCGVVPHGRHDRGDPHGDAAQQRWWRVGQRQEIHRDG